MDHIEREARDIHENAVYMSDCNCYYCRGAPFENVLREKYKEIAQLRENQARLAKEIKDMDAEIVQLTSEREALLTEGVKRDLEQKVRDAVKREALVNDVVCASREASSLYPNTYYAEVIGSIQALDAFDKEHMK